MKSQGFACPVCGLLNRVPLDQVGNAVSCQACRATIDVPQPPEPDSAKRSGGSVPSPRRASSISPSLEAKPDVDAELVTEGSWGVGETETNGRVATTRHPLTWLLAIGTVAAIVCGAVAMVKLRQSSVEVAAAPGAQKVTLVEPGTVIDEFLDPDIPDERKITLLSEPVDQQLVTQFFTEHQRDLESGVESIECSTGCRDG